MKLVGILIHVLLLAIATVIVLAAVGGILVILG